MLRLIPMASASLALLVLAACASEAGAPPAPSDPATKSVAEAEATETTTTNAPIPKRGALLLEAALKEPIDLTPAQRVTIEGLLAGLPDGPPPIGKALAAAVRSGESDQARFDKILADAAREESAPTAQALGKLHATLSREQRAKLVAAIAARPPQKFEARVMAEDAHAQHHASAKGGAGGAGGAGVVGVPQEVRVRVLADYRGKLDTFASDDFDPAAFAAPQVHVDDLASKIGSMTPEQRARLADHLEQGPKHRVIKHEIAPAVRPAGQ